MQNNCQHLRRDRGGRQPTNAHKFVTTTTTNTAHYHGKINIFFESISHLADKTVLKMRALGISAISLAMTTAVISHAYYQKKQFYPSVVYITKSNPSMTVSEHHLSDRATSNNICSLFFFFLVQVIYIQSLVLVLMLGKLMRKVSRVAAITMENVLNSPPHAQVFLGSLRAAEFEHLMERFWYALTETCLAFTVFRDDFNPKFVALFTVLLFLKSFHWLAEDRVDYVFHSIFVSFCVGCILHVLFRTDGT